MFIYIIIILRRLTTLYDQQRKEIMSSIVVTYHPKSNNRLKNALRSIGINLINRIQSKRKDLLGNPNDKSDSTEKSGIDKIDCKNCDMYYIEHTSREAGGRFEEHISKFRRR